MDDLWLRVALLALALAIAGVFVWWQRSQGAKGIHEADPGDLDPGVYFFSSSACPGCVGARDKLAARLGGSGFTEFSWEESPGVFADLDIDAVPAVLIVQSAGRATVYPGQPERALRSV